MQQWLLKKCFAIEIFKSNKHYLVVMHKKKGEPKDNRVLIIGVLIVFIIALIVLNLGNITGNASRVDVTKQEVSPQVVRAGEYINIKLYAGNEGASKKLRVCGVLDETCRDVADYKLRCADTNPKGALSAGFRVEPGETCESQFKTFGSWQAGDYFVQVLDYGTAEMVSDILTIIE